MAPYLEAWQAAAATFGVSVVQGWLGHRFVAKIEGVEVMVRTSFNSTVVEGAGTAPGELWLRIRHGWVYPIGRALGIQDIIVGDPPFDDRFIVKAHHEELAKLWLDAPARAHMLAAADYNYEVTGRVVAATYAKVIDERAATLEQAVRAVAALATRSKRLAQAWRPAAEALEGTMFSEVWQSGKPGFTVGPVTVDAVLEKGVFTTRIHAGAHGTTLPGFVTDIDALGKAVVEVAARARAPSAPKGPYR